MASFTPDADGRGHIVIKNEDGSSIMVYEQGAHLASWKDASGDERLYVSPSAVKRERVPLRGGVPIIFPQFGNRGPLTPSHGFARIRPWKVEEAGNGRGVFSLYANIDELSLENNPFSASDSQKNAVQLTYTITFSNERLKLGVEVRNFSEEVAANFHFCFHTYFRVDDIATTIVNGFNHSPYYDQLKKIDGKWESMKLNSPEAHWKIANGDEVDRIYPAQRCAVLLQEPSKKRALHISSIGLPDVVLWNPGAAKCKKDGGHGAFADLPEDGYKHFVCVEHCHVVRKITVPPSSSWSASQDICVLRPTAPESKM